MTAIFVSFALGVVACWAFIRLMRAAAFGGSKISSNARQKWLAKMNYEALLRTRQQIEDEIKTRQPHE